MTAVLPIEPSPSPRNRRAQAVAVVVVLAGHAVVLAILGLERSEIRYQIARSLEPPEAIPVILWPAAPKPTAASRAASRSAIVRPRAERKKKTEASPVAVPAGPPAPQARSGAGEGQGQGEGAGPGWPSFGPNLFRRIRPQVGCAHPEAYRLSGRERAGCDEAFGEEARNARPLGPMIPPGKQAVYDRMLRCRRIYDDNNTPTGMQPSNAAGGMRGLGYVPNLKDECPPGEH